MSQHIDFQPGDVIEQKYTNEQYTVLGMENGLLKLSGYEDMGYYFIPSYFRLSGKPTKAAKWKIESDGTNKGTKVYINGEEVHRIRRVEFTADVGLVPTLELSLLGESP